MSLNVFIAGHNGMVGSAIKRNLDISSHYVITRSKNELNLEHQGAVDEFFEQENIDIVINAAAKVGGILANDQYPYDFIMKNMTIQNNLIRASVNNKIKKFIFLGSSCIYPKHSKQPIKEEYILSGALEPTNQWYAIAKISGILACQAAKRQFGFNAVSLMPTNLYGPNDNFDLESSHVIPGIIRKMHEAKLNNTEVKLWGTGNPFREFLHVEDLANAVVFALEHDLVEDVYNIGFGKEISIKELAVIIKKVVGYNKKIIWDPKMPDGTKKKLMDSSKLREMGWRPVISLETGIQNTYDWFIKNN
jgi:GDP-L-fucose synthase